MAKQFKKSKIGNQIVFILWTDIVNVKKFLDAEIQNQLKQKVIWLRFFKKLFLIQKYGGTKETK